MSQKKGFTITETLIVVSIMTMLIGAAAVGFLNAGARARDYKRIEGVKTISHGLHEFVLEHDDLPNERCGPTDPSCRSGWEASAVAGGGENTRFLDFLMNEGILTEVPTDPLNARNDAVPLHDPRPNGNFYFMYHLYDQDFVCDTGTCTAGEFFGCEFEGPFAVVGFISAEAIDPSNLQKAQCGRNNCTCGPSWCAEDPGGPNACRDWSHEFDYSLIIPI